MRCFAFALDDEMELTSCCDPRHPDAIGNRSASSSECDVAAAIKEVFGMEIFGFDYLVDNITGIESVLSATCIDALLWCHSIYLSLCTSRQHVLSMQVCSMLLM